jgi:RNase P protein component
MIPSPEKRSPTIKDAIARKKAEQDKIDAIALRRAEDFETVFGQGKRRTPPQARVMEYLEACASDAENSYQFNKAGDGIALIAAGIHRDGAKSILQVIRLHLRNAAKRGFSTTTK